MRGVQPEFSVIDWSKSAFEIHNQVRTHRYMRSRTDPLASVGKDRLRVIRTSLEPAEGLEIVCGDGRPLWITEFELAQPAMHPTSEHLTTVVARCAG
ncbi:hypothetical protein [Actinospica robiniae]|uniref:hypothetical protein n=1 Tax=Actinospica robiniae TaxID=304901 RepID=UPI00316ABED7